MIVMPPALADYRDSFDRADNTDLGTDWRPDHSSCQISSNQAQCRALLSGTARTGGWETYTGDYGGHLLTDNWEIAAPLGVPTGSGSTSHFTAIGAGMQTAGPSTGMLLVYLAVSRSTGTSQGSHIMTWGGSALTPPAACTGQTGQTSRAAITSAIGDTDTIALRRRMYSATQSVFTALINGTAAFSWDDTTGVVPAGDPYRRRWFIVCEADRPQFLFQRSSPALASVTARDITI